MNRRQFIAAPVAAPAQGRMCSGSGRRTLWVIQDREEPFSHLGVSGGQRCALPRSGLACPTGLRANEESAANQRISASWAATSSPMARQAVAAGDGAFNT